VYRSNSISPHVDLLPALCACSVLILYLVFPVQGGLEGAGDAQPRSRAALRELLVEEYEGTGLHRKLSPLDIQVRVNMMSLCCLLHRLTALSPCTGHAVLC
jgi:hypothetical protein